MTFCRIPSNHFKLKVDNTSIYDSTHYQMYTSQIIFLCCTFNCLIMCTSAFTWQFVPLNLSLTWQFVPLNISHSVHIWIWSSLISRTPIKGLMCFQWHTGCTCNTPPRNITYLIPLEKHTRHCLILVIFLGIWGE